MVSIKSIVPSRAVSSILDLGGGTGRFTKALHEAYGCPVAVLDPSIAMLKEGLKRRLKGVSWACGRAEYIPVRDASFDFVWMCQVFHHLEDIQQALREVYRVLKPAGYFAIRNGTIESDSEIEWARFFPEAQEIDRGRIPSQGQVINAVAHQGFALLEAGTVYQLAASNYAEYYEKISRRGLSSLISISDEAFNAGLRRFKDWALRQPKNKPVSEAVDMFIFRRSGES